MYGNGKVDLPLFLERPTSLPNLNMEGAGQEAVISPQVDLETPRDGETTSQSSQQGETTSQSSHQGETISVSSSHQSETTSQSSHSRSGSGYGKQMLSCVVKNCF